MARTGREAALCRDRLSQSISGEGPLTLPSCPDSVWPTPLALLALLGDQAHFPKAALLSSYIINSSGYFHDPLAVIKDYSTGWRGWPWFKGAYSYVEPTAIAMLALSAAGHHDHPRVHEAREMLMDVQMPSGGWNYGNVSVFGARLKPDMVNTSAALCALAGRAAPGTVAKSLDYLESGAAATRTPLSLAWALLALGSWGRDAKDARQRLPLLLADHPVTGAQHTGTLALGSIALMSPDGLAAHLARRSAQGASPHAA